MTENWIPVSALALFLMTPLAFGQDEMGEEPAGQEMAMPGPAKELASYKSLVGSWKGKGTVCHEAGAPAMDWTSVSRFEWGFGGHWLVEKSVITMEGMPPLLFKTFYGWDAENKRHVAFGLNNMGQVSRSEIDWTPDGSMLTIENKMDMGRRAVSTSTSKWGKDSATFVMKQSINGEDPFVHVEGRYERVDAVELPTVDKAFPMPMPRPEMEKLSGMVGEYQMEGSMIMMPGAPEMQISATEAVSLRFEKALLVFKTKGDPTPAMGDFIYEGFVAMGWNAESNSYDAIYVNNVGEGGLYKGYWLADRHSLIMTFAGTYQGQPCVNRGVSVCTKDGKLESCYSHMLIGTHEPIRNFKGTYKVKQQG